MATPGLHEWITSSAAATDDERVAAAERVVTGIAALALQQIPSATTQLRQRAERGLANRIDHLVLDEPSADALTALAALGWSPADGEPTRLVHTGGEHIAQLVITTSAEPGASAAGAPASDNELAEQLGARCRHVAVRVDDAAEAADDAAVHGLPVDDEARVSANGRVREIRHRQTGGGEPPTFGLIERSADDGGHLDLTLDLVDRAVWDDAAAAGARRVMRPAYTFKVRRRHLSAKRQAEFDEWIMKWSIDVDGPPLDWDAVFHRDLSDPNDPADPNDPNDPGQPSGRRNGLDIGFGHGETTIGMARAEPDLDVIGIEVHDPGVVTVLDAIENEPLRNIRVVHGDVLRFLRRVEADSLDVVRIFFPDPWKKVRQHHRRLVRDDVVAALTDRLRPGGVLHLATDIADYAEQMQAACDAEPRLVGGVIERPPERPMTRFERRGLDAGRPAVDLQYRRTADTPTDASTDTPTDTPATAPADTPADTPG